MDGDLAKKEQEMATALIEDQARLLKVLGNPSRLRLLMLLMREPMHVGNLESALGLGQAYVSQQLARLRNEGIVEGKRSGRAVLYRVVDARVAHVVEALSR
ncbi:MAG: metalloregulator ArsR/SmtB family transcription factor [Pseudomonadota bacterium]